MFNYGTTGYRYNNWKVLGGLGPGDYSSHRTLFAGPDPADPSRVLVRKLVKADTNTWCLEESTITPRGESSPTVHTTLMRLGNNDIEEMVSEEEMQLRLLYRPMPSVVGFSLFSRAKQGGSTSNVTLVENTFEKAGSRWLEWFKDWQDRRSLAGYLRMRWTLN